MHVEIIYILKTFNVGTLVCWFGTALSFKNPRFRKESVAYLNKMDSCDFFSRSKTFI